MLKQNKKCDIILESYILKKNLLGMLHMFNCDKCGYCCSNLDSSPLYADLDRGDGVCRYFDTDTRLCTIYADRPLKCNIDKTYELFFKDKMTLDEYYSLNYDACKKLKKTGRKP